jgi:glutamine synthetase
MMSLKEKNKEIEKIKAYIDEHQIKNIKVAIVDIDGVLRGKYVNMNKFLSALDVGFGFCNVVFGWDSDDVLYKEDSYTDAQNYLYQAKLMQEEQQKK